MNLCAVKWCACIATKGNKCAVHAVDPEVRPSLLADNEEMVSVPVACAECHGSGKCEDCDGQGTHMCDVRSCYHEHECGPCDGSGECPECEGAGHSGIVKKEPERDHIGYPLHPSFYSQIQKGSR